MTEIMAIEMARCKMRELGHGKNYTLRYRAIFLEAGEVKTLDMGNDLMILTEVGSYQMVKSKAGIFNTTSPQSAEMQFVHTGKVTLTNLYEGGKMGFTFLQVIPLTKKS